LFLLVLAEEMVVVVGVGDVLVAVVVVDDHGVGGFATA
jgi:hypothetical protein